MTLQGRNLVASALCLLLSASACEPAPRPFLLAVEMYGPRAYTAPEVDWLLQNGMANAMVFHDPADAGMRDELASHPGTGFLFQFFGATKVRGSSASYIEAQRQQAASLCAAVGRNRSAWNLMPEWDQAGGHWVPDGRPRYLGLTPRQAFERFTDYYLNQSPPLGTYLREARSARACRLTSQTDVPMNVFYGYEMGLDSQMLERAIDELGDIATGLAFVRGAGRQYGRQWGVDISTWRTTADSATSYDVDDRQTGGWSASYLKRHMMAAYLGGARTLQIEATQFFHPSGELNPLGRVLQEFGDFALVRHPDLGDPAPTFALMLGFHDGFDPKHWLYLQGDAVWYQDIPYSDGDHMTDELLAAAYPHHWLHGLTPGAPFTTASGYQQFLAAGGDPRPYEPMPFTRWGSDIDVVLDNASAAALGRYRVIVLTGGAALDDATWAKLGTWVRSGGILVVNQSQVDGADEPLLGVDLSGTMRSGSASRWLADAARLGEPAFQYERVTPTTASVLATNDGADALVTSNAVGAGRVILTTPAHMLASDRTRLLSVAVRLLDSLHAETAVARVSGPPCMYGINRDAGRIIVTVINNAASVWRGTVTIPVPGPATAVREYWTDTDAPHHEANRVVSITAEVPIYETRVYGVEFAPAGGARELVP